MRSSASGSDQKMIQLQDEIEELTVWKDKVQTQSCNAWHPLENCVDLVL